MPEKQGTVIKDAREIESPRATSDLEHREKRLGKIPGSDAVVESSHGETLKYREGRELMHPSHARLTRPLP